MCINIQCKYNKAYIFTLSPGFGNLAVWTAVGAVKVVDNDRIDHIGCRLLIFLVRIRSCLEKV